MFDSMLGKSWTIIFGSSSCQEFCKCSPGPFRYFGISLLGVRFKLNRRCAKRSKESPVQPQSRSSCSRFVLNESCRCPRIPCRTYLRRLQPEPLARAVSSRRITNHAVFCVIPRSRAISDAPLTSFVLTTSHNVGSHLSNPRAESSKSAPVFRENVGLGCPA